MDKLLADLEEEKAKRDRPKSKSPTPQLSPMTPIDSSHVPVSMSATTLSGMSELRNDILDDPPELGIPNKPLWRCWYLFSIQKSYSHVVFNKKKTD